MPHTSDQKLLDRIRQGDLAALGDVLERQQQRLYNIALRMVSNREDAAEVTQEAMLKIIEHIHDFHGQSSLSTWMIRIVMNMAISHLRRRKLRQTTSLDGNGQDHGDNQLSALSQELADNREPEPSACVEKKEMLARLQAAMAQLDEEFRAVLVLRDIDQMDYADIAITLSLPVGTVKSRLFRARLALRQEMMRKGPIPEVSAFCLDNPTTRDMKRPMPWPQPKDQEP